MAATDSTIRVSPMEKDLEMLFRVYMAIEAKPNVDWAQVAQEMDFKTPKSAYYRFWTMRKKLSEKYPNAGGAENLAVSGDDMLSNGKEPAAEEPASEFAAKEHASDEHTYKEAAAEESVAKASVAIKKPRTKRAATAAAATSMPAAKATKVEGTSRTRGRPRKNATAAAAEQSRAHVDPGYSIVFPAGAKVENENEDDEEPLFQEQMMMEKSRIDAKKEDTPSDVLVVKMKETESRTID